MPRVSTEPDLAHIRAAIATACRKWRGESDASDENVLPARPDLSADGSTPTQDQRAEKTIEEVHAETLEKLLRTENREALMRLAKFASEWPDPKHGASEVIIRIAVALQEAEVELGPTVKVLSREWDAQVQPARDLAASIRRLVDDFPPGGLSLDPEALAQEAEELSRRVEFVASGLAAIQHEPYRDRDAMGLSTVDRQRDDVLARGVWRRLAAQFRLAPQERPRIAMVTSLIHAMFETEVDERSIADDVRKFWSGKLRPGRIAPE